MTHEELVEEMAAGFESWDSFYSGLTIEQETEQDTTKLYESYLIEYIKDALTSTAQRVREETIEDVLAICEKEVEQAVIRDEHGGTGKETAKIILAHLSTLNK